MANRSYRHSSWQMFILLLILGGIIGECLGEIITKLWPASAISQYLDFS